ncbi:MAG TPA: lysozyme inhibitor LprI family protein [Methylophilaceae bacterium]
MRLLLLMFALLCSTAAFAKCDPDNEEIQECYDQTLKTADKNLNVAYQRLMKLLTPADQTKLRETERSWLQFIEQNCRFESSAYSGGTIEPIAYTRCLIEETEARTKELNKSNHYDANGKCSPSDTSCSDK